MRRYRKGQIFRPPSAAESAASADAVEAFRRRPSVSQDRLARGGKILVKTPEGGIDARDGTTIYSAMCTRCVETSTAEEKEILETDEELEVFNLDTTDVAGEIYVQTGLTLHDTRCVEAGSLQWEWGKLDDVLNTDDTATMSVWRGDPLADTEDNITVSSPPIAFGAIASDSWVWAMKHSNGLWYVLGAQCE